MLKKTPWDDIGHPDRGYDVKQVTSDGTVPLFWGKNFSGHCVFIVELHGNHVDLFHKENTFVRGIGVDLQERDSTKGQRLVLTLEKQVNKDLFLGLCETLISNLLPVKNSETAIALTLTHIKRWKAFMADGKGRFLSAEEIRGLFGELLFLRFLYQERLKKQEALDAWCGPDNTQQDFIFGNTAVEIKTLSGRERNTIRISSEDQLASLCDHLFLIIYRLSDGQDSHNSLSLNCLVRLMEDELSDTETIEKFHERLASHHYVEMPEYDTPKFLETSQHAYRVVDDFPRLIRSNLSDGVIRVRYELKLEKLQKFECDSGEIGGD